MNVLISGAGGFIGSHCLEYWLDKTDWDFLIIDSFAHKGTYSRLNAIPNWDSKRIKVFHHDLTAPIDRQLENQLLAKRLDTSRLLCEVKHESIDYIINIASDSAVERSISNPRACWNNNCQLMLNMLEFANVVMPKMFLHYSSDEVYGEVEDQPHKEWDTILPSNVYSASKAAQESLAISYFRTYNLPVVLMNCMNVIGERQDTEKFLPKLIYKIATGKQMEIYGAEKDKIGSRFYIHAKSVADAVLFLSNIKPAKYSEGNKRPDRYNVVGDVELDNLEVARMVAGIMQKDLNYRLIPAERARKGYDKRYGLDGKKMYDLGWRHPINTVDSIKQIVEWTLKNPHWII